MSAVLLLCRCLCHTPPFFFRSLRSHSLAHRPFAACPSLWLLHISPISCCATVLGRVCRLCLRRCCFAGFAYTAVPSCTQCALDVCVCTPRAFVCVTLPESSSPSYSVSRSQCARLHLPFTATSRASLESNHSPCLEKSSDDPLTTLYASDALLLLLCAVLSRLRLACCIVTVFTCAQFAGDVCLFVCFT